MLISTVKNYLGLSYYSAPVQMHCFAHRWINLANYASNLYLGYILCYKPPPPEQTDGLMDANDA